ncbi:MAG: STAS domain-containing protein [Gemmatimonadetes bacterium]|nr:STAS domain-containing protein [Gemmatimonadota bacterium]
MTLDRDHRPVIVVPDQLTAETWLAMDEAARWCLERGGSEVVFDLSATEAIDGSGLALLVAVSREAERVSRRVRIVGISDRLRALFRLARIEGSFEFGDEPVAPAGASGAA